MQNMTELRMELADLFTEVKEGKVEAKTAKEMTNIAGKIIASVAIQLKGHDLNKTKHRIDFLK